MNIPALIEVDIKEEWNGKMAVVDGYTGTFYIDPDEETLKKMQEKKEEDIKARELLQELKGKRRRNCRWKTHQIICKYRWRKRRCKRTCQ